jgi:hypothetical protein
MQALQRAGATGLEPATSGVTGRRSNQLSYAPKGGRVAARRGLSQGRWIRSLKVPGERRVGLITMPRRGWPQTV